MPDTTGRCVRSLLVPAAAIWLALAGPCLLFPGLLPSSWRPALFAASHFTIVAALLVMMPIRTVRWPLAAFAAAVVASGFRVPLTSVALPHFGTLSAGMLLMALTAVWSCTPRRRRIVACVVLGLGLLMLLVALPSALLARPKLLPLALTDWLPDLSLPLHGVTSDGMAGRVNANALAAAALLVLGFALPLAFAPPSPGRGRLITVLARIAGSLGLLAVLASQSRTALLFAAAVLLGALALAGRRRGVRMELVGIAIILIAGAGASLTNATAVARRFDSARTSLAQRLELWGAGAHLVGENPVRGIGLNQFGERVPPAGVYRERVPHAHNVVLQIALDLGIPGLLAYLALLGALAGHARNVLMSGAPADRGIAGAALLCIAAVHLFGVTDAVALGAKIGTFQWLSAGLLISLDSTRTDHLLCSPYTTHDRDSKPRS